MFLYWRHTTSTEYWQHCSCWFHLLYFESHCSNAYSVVVYECDIIESSMRNSTKVCRRSFRRGYSVASTHDCVLILFTGAFKVFAVNSKITTQLNFENTLKDKGPFHRAIFPLFFCFENVWKCRNPTFLRVGSDIFTHFQNRKKWKNGAVKRSLISRIFHFSRCVLFTETCIW